MAGEQETPDLLRRNVENVVALEAHAASDLTWSEALAERIGGFMGTLSFVAVHAVAVAGWVMVNAGWVPALRPFDRYPFNLLSTVASVEAVFLAAIVLMKQNRMARLGHRREHLDLQVNLLTEQEASITIQMLDAISRKLEVDLPAREDALRLSRTATLENLVRELHQRLPDTGSDLPPDLIVAPPTEPDVKLRK